MPPLHFSVSQVRAAVACPRIFFFDHQHTVAQKLKTPRISRIWKTGAGSETTACGSLFHQTIEGFNRQAARLVELRQSVEQSRDRDELAQVLLRYVYEHHVPREKLFEKGGPEQQAFMNALRVYLGELADIIAHARTLQKPLAEVLDEMFGDRRKSVKVIFAVGPEGEEVQVSGVLDYVFFDWRTGGHRIIDYKLTPADKPSLDIFQVCMYALMHHRQHGTSPAGGVLYLHPERKMIECSWPQIFQEQYKIHDLLASMAGWIRYDPIRQEGLKPPGEPLYCNVCPWSEECERTLGPKMEGSRVQDRRELPLASPPSFENEVQTPDETLWIGELAGNPVTIPVNSLSTHFAVVGAAGSGKTWMAKVLAEEALLHGIPVLAVDPQGDLVQMLHTCPSPPELNPWQGRYQRWKQLADPRVFTPGTSHAIRVCLSPLRIPQELDPANFSSDQRRREELESLFRTIAGNLVQLARAGGDSDCQRAFLYRILRHLTEKSQDHLVNLETIARTVADPESIGVEDADLLIRKTEREKLARKLHAILHGPSANLFSGGQPVDLEQWLVPATAGKVALNVVYLNALADDDQKQFFVGALATEIYRWMISTGNPGKRPRLLFYLDEARDFLPAGARKPPAKDPLLRLFSQGRKFGVACLVCTQSPRSVDYNVFSNCSTKIIGRLESSQDVERVAEWFQKEGPTPAWLADRKGAAAGSFMGRWPEQRVEFVDQSWTSRPLFTLHEGAWSPQRVEQETQELRADSWKG